MQVIRSSHLACVQKLKHKLVLLTVGAFVGRAILEVWRRR